jgi:hypothetical protein
MGFDRSNFSRRSDRIAGANRREKLHRMRGMEQTEKVGVKVAVGHHGEHGEPGDDRGEHWGRDDSAGRIVVEVVRVIVVAGAGVILHGVEGDRGGQGRIGFAEACGVERHFCQNRLLLRRPHGPNFNWLDWAQFHREYLLKQPRLY